MEFAKEAKEFFENIRRCDKCHKGDCKYLGTLDERLAKYKELREAEEQKKKADRTAGQLNKG